MNFKVSDLLLHCTLLATMFLMMRSSVLLEWEILVENFVHCGFLVLVALVGSEGPWEGVSGVLSW